MEVCCNNIISLIVSFSLKLQTDPPPAAAHISQRFILPSNLDILAEISLAILLSDINLCFAIRDILDWEE